ncbi:MAG: SDR family NAD(P)-dependent oxidoreductase [Novosphingobium sp.]
MTFGPTTTAEEVAAGHDLSGKRVVITGASSGLGAETARVLGVMGADHVLAARDTAACESLADDLEQKTGRRAQVVRLDLGDLGSVRACARAIGAAPIHVLINNAGVMATPFGRTKDGFETQFGVNHLGHFVLTRALLPSLEAGAPARVIQLSSAGHIWSRIDFDDLDFEGREYNPWVAYGQSKTANILFAVELTRRYRDKGITANAVMPGRIDETGLGRHTTAQAVAVMPPMSVTEGATPPDPAVRMKTTAEGAATTVWAALAPELEGVGGLYLEDCAVAQPWSSARPRRGVKPYALDPALAARLWQLSSDLTEAFAAPPASA